MVKIITPSRTTSRSPSPLPFNSLFFSFLVLSHALFPLFPPPPSLFLSLSIIPFFPLSAIPPSCPLLFSLYPLRNSLPFLLRGLFPHLGHLRLLFSRVQQDRGSLVAWASLVGELSY